MNSEEGYLGSQELNPAENHPAALQNENRKTSMTGPEALGQKIAAPLVRPVDSSRTDASH